MLNEVLNSEKAPLFLGGTGRSGTTVLKKVLLGSQSIIGCKNEIRFVVDPHGVIDLFNNLSCQWDPYRADSAIKEFDQLVRKSLNGGIVSAASRHFLSKAKIAPPSYRHIRLNEKQRSMMLEKHDQFINKLYSATSDTIWLGSAGFSCNPQLYETKHHDGELLSDLFSSHFSSFFSKLEEPKIASAKYWLDDTPYSILNAGSLKNIFHDAKFIHIYRDPREVVASYLHQRWGGNKKSLKNIVNRVKFVYEKINFEKSKLASDCFIELSFEAMLEAPRATLNSVTDKIGISIDDECLEIISEKKTSSYSTYFTVDELSMIDEVLKDEITKYGKC